MDETAREPRWASPTAPSCRPHRAEVEVRDRVGVEKFLFGMDFPHPGGTWPDTWDWIRDAFAGVPEDPDDKVRAIPAIDAARTATSAP